MELGKRINLARKAMGLSMRGLAQKMNISPMSISKYERGLMNPSSSILLEMADVLNVSVEFFFRPPPESISLVMYRKHASLGKTELNAIHANIQEWLERYLEAESYFESEGEPINIWKKYLANSLEDIEQVADKVRYDWNLGIDPIDNLINILETHGIKIGMIDSRDCFDGCTFKSNGQPVIAVRNNTCGDRQRFSIAHELGHIVLDVDEDIEEKAAHRFAAAFLFPKSSVLQELGEHRTCLNLDELYLLKHKYGISMQAIIRRAKDLGIINDSYYRELCITFSQKGYRRQEPGKPVKSEEPARMQLLLLRLLAEDILTKSKVEELNGGPIIELGAILQSDCQQ